MFFLSLAGSKLARRCEAGSGSFHNSRPEPTNFSKPQKRRPSRTSAERSAGIKPSRTFFFYSSHVFGGFSSSLRGPNLGMVVRGLLSVSPRSSSGQTLPLSAEDLRCISPRCARPDLLYRRGRGEGYLSAPNPRSLNYFHSTLTACVFI